MQACSDLLTDHIRQVFSNHESYWLLVVELGLYRIRLTGNEKTTSALKPRSSLSMAIIELTMRIVWSTPTVSAIAVLVFAKDVLGDAFHQESDRQRDGTQALNHEPCIGKANTTAWFPAVEMTELVRFILEFLAQVARRDN
ncbi:hypothetical protein BASA60_009539 [Batrachochytrium salamandrivorans]|nr:hypothetical protein BASA60_009539 [Batrachochytrium salamandrivorans]